MSMISGQEAVITLLQNMVIHYCSGDKHPKMVKNQKNIEPLPWGLCLIECISIFKYMVKPDGCFVGLNSS